MSNNENFNCSSKFITNASQGIRNTPISFASDTRSLKTVIKLDSSPEEFLKHMQERFPEYKSEFTNQPISVELNHNNSSEENAIVTGMGASNITDNTILNSLYCNSNNTIENSNRNVFISNDSITKNKVSKNVFDMKEYLKTIHNFIYLDNLLCYDEALGYYRKLTKDDLGTIVYSVFNYDLMRQVNPYRDIAAIYKSLCLDPSIRDTTFVNNELSINCINGVLSFYNATMSFTNHDKIYRFTNCINATFINYDISIANTHFAFFLNTITNGDLQLQNLIRQVLGYILSNFNNAKKFFVFYGKSNSGKSVLIDLISHIIGEENISNIDMENLSDPKYTAELSGKLLNVCSELPDKGINDTGIIKALVSENDKVSARHLYNSPFSFYNKAKLIFATNNLPEIKTTSYKDNSAFFNRILIIPFLVSIPDANQDKYLLKKLLLEKDIIFSWAIGGLKDYIDSGYQFSYSFISQRYLDQYKRTSNNYVEFINSRCEINEDSYVFIDDLFSEYKNFCYENLLDDPTNKDKKFLIKILADSPNVTYKRLHRGGYNKWGFDGIRLVNCK